MNGDDERSAVSQRRGVRGAEEKVDVTGGTAQSPVEGRPAGPRELVHAKRVRGRQRVGRDAFGHEDDDLAELRLGVGPLAQELRDVAADAGARADEAMAVDPQRRAQGSAVRSERPPSSGAARRTLRAFSR